MEIGSNPGTLHGVLEDGGLWYGGGTLSRGRVRTLDP